MDGTIKVSDGAVGAGAAGPVGAVRQRAGLARGAGVPEDVATLPSFRAPASRGLLPRSGGESHSRGRPSGLTTDSDLPRTPCPKAAPGPYLRAAGRAAGGGPRET